MASTTFSGPVTSTNGFVVGADSFIALTAQTTASLPTAAAVNAGHVRLINDNGAGNNEFCLVISNGSAWVTAVGAALS